MGLPLQEYWSGLPLPSLGDLPNSGIKLASPALAGTFFTTDPSGKGERWPKNTRPPRICEGDLPWK